MTLARELADVELRTSVASHYWTPFASVELFFDRADHQRGCADELARLFQK